MNGRTTPKIFGQSIRIRVEPPSHFRNRDSRPLRLMLTMLDTKGVGLTVGEAKRLHRDLGKALGLVDREVSRGGK